MLGGIGNWSRSTGNKTKKVQGDRGEVTSNIGEDNFQARVPMLPAMPTDFADLSNCTNQDIEEAALVGNSSVSNTSVPSEVAVEEVEDISLVSLPSVSVQETAHHTESHNNVHETPHLFLFRKNCSEVKNEKMKF